MSEVPAPALIVTGAVVPLPRDNVDTDLILPSRYMKTLGREGLGEGAFEALRGQTGNPFDDPRYRGAPILLAGANFGCGSSREHAVWALQQIGLRAVIAPSFGEIFETNALRNGLIAVRLPQRQIDRLLTLAPEQRVTVDVGEQVVIADGDRLPFALDPFRSYCLLNELDDIAVTEALDPEIAAWEERSRNERPWAFPLA